GHREFLLPLLVLQLDKLNEVAAGVVEHRDGRAGDIRRQHRELSAMGADPFVIALHVVGIEHGRGLALLKHRLLKCLSRWVVLQRELQLSSIRLLGRGHSQPAKWALTEIGLLGKAEYLGIETEGLVLIVYVYAGQFDFHFSSSFRHFVQNLFPSILKNRQI